MERVTIYLEPDLVAWVLAEAEACGYDRPQGGGGVSPIVREIVRLAMDAGWEVGKSLTIGEV